MSKINILSSEVYNRISAGEVVDRPASVVKELVENSIDSGAKNISISIIDGGITQIIVSDDGSGIEKSQLKNAILPHATSKINDVDDLEKISTLGFRGEALASIAAVSKLTIISKTKEQENGSSISVYGGQIDCVKDSPAVDGTEITVNNLFFNTPAREKFLKTPKGEESEITAVVSRFILGNKDISFRYLINGKLVYQSYGDGLESSMIKIYGEEILKDCLLVSTNKNGINIEGYIGKNYFSKSNRSYQTVFLNGRYILNQTISSAITNAYSSYLMKRQYPFYVLSITVPPEIVDVNVHPNKIDVRFSNNQIIYGTIYSVLSKVLDGISEALNIVVDNSKTHINTNENIDNYVRHNNFNAPSNIEKIDKIIFNDGGIVESKSFEEDKLNQKENNVYDIFAENKAYIEKLEREKLEKKDEIQQHIVLSKTLSFVGQILNTFLIFEDGDDMYMVDQHAAHERILYDKFLGQISSKSVYIQNLFLPYILNVNSFEFSFLNENIDLLKSMGIEIEEFGENTFRITSIPLILSDINLKDFFEDIASDLSSLKSVSLTSILKEKIAQKACKAAIKSGDKLNESEIKALMEQLQNNFGLKCPHGRPIAVKISRIEIDKWFKRIV